MDRDALVRRARRRQALDALAFERDRAAMLAEQLEETVATLDGAQVDATLYTQLTPDEVELVRAALGESDLASAIEDDADAEPYDDADAAQQDEEEILRLQGELDRSGQLQAALERYLEVL